MKRKPPSRGLAAFCDLILEKYFSRRKRCL
jgi:hypothetical protein